MNHAGEIEPLTRLVRPHVAIITTVEPVHLEFFGSVEAIADAKAEIFPGLEPGGAAVINRDNPQFARLQSAAKAAGVARIVSFGEHAKADARLLKCALQPDCSTVQARILGTDVTYKLGAPGRHVVLNSLAVLAAVSLAGADLALAALALAELKPPTGRGARITLDLPRRHGAADRRKLQRQSGLDAARRSRCSARPRSGRAAGASRCSATCWNSARAAPICIANWPSRCRRTASIWCSAVGPLMRALWEALPSERRGGYADNSAALESQCARRHPPGRRRHGQGLARLADGADRQGAGAPLCARRNAGGARPTFNRYRLIHALLAVRTLRHFRSPQRLPLHHVPHRRGDDHRARLRVPVRAVDHRPSAVAAGQGPADPHRRAAIASRHQEGHAHHGRADDPVRDRGVDGAVGQSGQPLCLDRARRDAVLRRDRLLRRLSQGHQADP